MKTSLCYSSSALHSVKHKNDEPSHVVARRSPAPPPPPPLVSSSASRRAAGGSSLPIRPAAAPESLPSRRRRCRAPLLTLTRPSALLIGRVTAAPLHCWPAAASHRRSRRRSRRRAGESPDLLCHRPAGTLSAAGLRAAGRHRAAHRAAPPSRDTAGSSPASSSPAGAPSLSFSLLPPDHSLFLVLSDLLFSL
ncbi:hypothetical protein Scep_027977 [Stephania cephalantha]|uniref:Uncharacterized protein n=1 Tax=Stephania cephalantha TaxID=152367 RepID=A0AAP0EB97_9MAGN